MKLLRAALFVLTAFAGMALPAHGQGVHPVPEQRLFSDSRVRRPVTLSPEVLKVLLETEQARGQFAAMSDSETKNPSQFLEAAEVHLRRPDEVDLVVIGIGRMAGADNAWFWLVRTARKDPKVVLFSSGSSLYVMDTKTDGCRDIRDIWSSSSETLTTIYHFNGSDYQIWKRHSKITH